MWAGVVSVFRDFGYRRLRSRARLKFLDRRLGRREVPRGAGEGLPRPRAARRPGARAARPTPATASVCTSRRTAVTTSASRRRSAGSTVTCCAEVADVVEAHGSQRVRDHGRTRSCSCWTSRTDAGRAADRGARRRSGSARGRACSGGTPWPAPGSSSASWPSSRPRVWRAATVTELESRLADVVEQIDVPISLNVNGCPNSCARIQTADIGLKGQIVTVDGQQVEGFQVHLGGGIGLDAGFGRKVRGLKVTADGLPAYVERVVRRFVAEREPAERFADLGGPGRRGGAGMSEGALRRPALPLLRRGGPPADTRTATARGSCVSVPPRLRRPADRHLAGRPHGRRGCTDEPAGSAPPHGSPS